jgi:hypothetical protein
VLCNDEAPTTSNEFSNVVAPATAKVLCNDEAPTTSNEFSNVVAPATAKVLCNDEAPTTSMLRCYVTMKLQQHLTNFLM